MTSVAKYFYGEKFRCYANITFSLASILTATILLSSLEVPFLKGLAYPLIFFPCLSLVVSLFVLLNVSRDIRRVESIIQSQPERIRIDEFPRLRRLLRNLTLIKWSTFVMAIIGLHMSFATRPFVAGTGLGLLIQAALLFGIAHFAIQSSVLYWEFLQNTYRCHLQKLGFKFSPGQKF